ncbi:anti-sigma factor [Actinoplanes ianthinogenes]|uniref:anti-sigma factor n=1 Tax=Actinoplanes ianthinogenes TaxID=122358 RepID=UPI001E41F284|nr:anti-sigma factor [Actinoplanes ianthinogenes]
MSESEHLARCAVCRHDFESLRTVADLGAQTEELRDLPPPPERIWRAIEADITGPARPVAPVTDLATRRGRFRRLRPLIAAAAAVVLAVAGTVAVDRYLTRPPAEQVTARATLSPLPTVPPSAGGSVQVLAGGEMRIDVRNLPLTSGFHEVWLIDPDDLTKMVAIGNLTARSEAVLPVPPGTDLSRYRLVDVSDEPHDGDAAHSGHSLLRGTLTN